MKKFLIYYILIGDKHRKALDLSIVSLKQTNYEGKIIVISDTVYKEDNVKNILVPTERGLGLRTVGTILKTKITEFINIFKYNLIVCLDADVLINPYHNIMKYFSKISSTNKIYIQKHTRPLCHKYLGRSLTKEEKEKYGKISGYCAGLFAIPGSSKGYKFIEKWRKEIEHPNPKATKKTFNDQSSLNALIIREYQNKIEDLDASFYYNRRRAKNNPNSIFVHFKAKTHIMSNISKEDYIKRCFKK